MDPTEDVLAMAERHVREGERRVARQIAIAEEMERDRFFAFGLADLCERILRTGSLATRSPAASGCARNCKYFSTAVDEAYLPGNH